MKLSDITVIASCAALVLSQPLEKRYVVVETVYEEVVQTVDVTTTYYVQPGDHAPSASVTPDVVVASSPVAAVEPASTPSAVAVNSPSFLRYKHKHTRKSSVTPSPSPPPPPPPVETVTPEAPPPPPPSVTPEAPPPPPPSVTPEAPPPPPPSVTPEAPPPPPPSVTPVAPASAAPQEAHEDSYSINSQPSPVAEAPPPPPPSVTPAPPPVPPPATGGNGGSCGQVGGKCIGDLTFYDAGLGACGWYNDGNSEAVFALAHGMMGEQSNGNPFCGRTATITANGKSVVAKLVDKCMGCDGQSVDLSNYAIDQIMDRSVGRMHNVEWYFND